MPEEKEQKKGPPISFFTTFCWLSVPKGGENRLENGKERKDEGRQKGKRAPLPLSGAWALCKSDNHNVRRRHDPSPSQQNRDALLHSRLGFFAQHRVTVIADRVGNHGKRVLRHS